MNKRLWIVANWKSNKTIKEALEWVSYVGPKIERKESIKIVVCPSFSLLSEVKKAVAVGNFPIIVGVQDLSPFGVGAYTGEESAELIKEVTELAILGHSERRQNFGETDEMVSKKVMQALENQIIPLVCVQGKETPVPEGVKLIAYEPVFAIGTGNPDSPESANEVAGYFKQSFGENLEVLYGGSVTPENVKGFVLKENISGVLAGGASLDRQEFIKIVQAAYALY